MAVTVTEEITSGAITSSGGTARLTKRYYVEGMTAETMAYDVLNASTPSTLSGLFKSSVSVDPVETADNDTWLGVVEYSSRKRLDIGESQFSFDVSTNQILKRYVDTPGDQQLIGTVPEGDIDPSGAIGFDGKTVNGVQVHVPFYTWQETHYFLFDFVSPQYKIKLADMVAHTNEQKFRGFPKESVLFLGANGTVQDVPGGAESGFENLKRWEIGYKFAYSKRLTDLSVGSLIIPVKEGWHHMYVKTTASEDGSSEEPTPSYVCLDRIYQPVNFSDLGIGIAAV